MVLGLAENGQELMFAMIVAKAFKGFFDGKESIGGDMGAKFFTVVKWNDQDNYYVILHICKTLVEARKLAQPLVDVQVHEVEAERKSLEEEIEF
jgi:hypothetical protein